MTSLNAPFGARCFLTQDTTSIDTAIKAIVLMYRLVLILQGCRKMSHAIRLTVLQVFKSER